MEDLLFDLNNIIGNAIAVIDEAVDDGIVDFNPALDAIQARLEDALAKVQDMQGVPRIVGR